MRRELFKIKIKESEHIGMSIYYKKNNSNKGSILNKQKPENKVEKIEKSSSQFDTKA